MELPKHYNFEESEIKWQKYWEKEQIYKFETENLDKDLFTIDTPPPTVSGKIHMGHAFGYSQFDFIGRYKRMKGFNVLQPLGTDDNGLPTQTLIQKTKNVKAQLMERKEFVKLCNDTLNEELKPKYVSDFKRLGMGYNWEFTYSTIDKHCQKISQKSFLDLYKAGRQYRSESASMYCSKCETAISQVECEDEELDSFFNDIVFKVKNEDGTHEDLVIATTRPELLPACVSIFYHPGDERYKRLKGKLAKVPLFDFEVPILEDERANPEKGTGIVMCCTFGDSTDVEWQKAHNLPIKEAINRQGKMTNLSGKYEGLSIKDAQKEIIEDLKGNNLLVSQKKIRHSVNVHERCGTPIEFVHSKQWFVKYLDLRDDMLEWGNKLNWFPEHMKNRYDNWVKGLQWDWCISRQIYFGIPFPVWYCEDCDEVILAKEEDLPVDPVVDNSPTNSCPECGSKNIIPEKDIINTWATSSLTPTIVKELFKDKPVYNLLKDRAMDLRPQGHDIITFWLFNTVVKSQLHQGILPWKDCFIHGWMLDPNGKKMSKSKGNVVEPQEMMDKYSSDALRYMAGGCKLGDDLSFPETEVAVGKKTITKLWNASKFSIMHLEDYDFSLNNNYLRAVDRWAISKLNKLIKSSIDDFEVYHFHRVRLNLDNFFWNSFCDLYLEIVKDRLYNPEEWGGEARAGGQQTLCNLLLTQLKMFAPFMPHITEEIYHLYFSEKEKCKSIHISKWPEYKESLIDETAEKIGDVLVKIVSEVRRAKTEKQLSMKAPVKMLKIRSELTPDEFEQIEKEVEKTLFAEDIEYEEGDFNLEINFE